MATWIITEYAYYDPYEDLILIAMSKKELGCSRWLKNEKLYDLIFLGEV